MSFVELSVLGCDIRAQCMYEEAESLLNNIYFSFKRPVKHAHVSYLLA
jgi:hypothetical protein